MAVITRADTSAATTLLVDGAKSNASVEEP